MKIVWPSSYCSGTCHLRIISVDSYNRIGSSVHDILLSRPARNGSDIFPCHSFLASRFGSRSVRAIRAPARDANLTRPSKALVLSRQTTFWRGIPVHRQTSIMALSSGTARVSLSFCRQEGVSADASVGLYVRVTVKVISEIATAGLHAERQHGRRRK